MFDKFKRAIFLNNLISVIFLMIEIKEVKKNLLFRIKQIPGVMKWRDYGKIIIVDCSLNCSVSINDNAAAAPN
ncbi:hypothetical protein AWQ23_06580 [Picosynechococcus sp. PCC 73109]|nr:hypothetical protein AWQ23_06580 [Picosynechococcus sp. PCC 73109]